MSALGKGCGYAVLIADTSLQMVFEVGSALSASPHRVWGAATRKDAGGALPAADAPRGGPQHFSGVIPALISKWAIGVF